ncbi:Myb-like DNA-binding domain containing protein [Trichomonas vaginalis G3]|uniref:Myb-like DNA-binding domain containing protein n=1 Tax=Trichomonas vaginalis (strain ATCC PRA-98 / G3) TaxID=412133 RepID=A2GJ91_TRIV3|nr:RNA polymerase II transcription regulator recruiting protein [Trichomonas vaginalis G3]EAX82776.1 Myb-like DNA-binding domain containing protein [Trichomonas vaginalis G3]KAI5542715.1 RNA polymerase II transcription regulator recruiting protein [Trichomonas vaginalis G3]|eukprot:XP_001295706.1 Myb-like DNA-binding domain containing protein [Trichomonas vaginalis G3]
MDAGFGNSQKTVLHRQVFTSYEDARLKLLVQQYGEKNWNLISCMMPCRTPRQCRERYKGHLSPEILNLPWTPQEDRLLIEKYTVLGRKWSKIAKFFVGRSDSNIKNRWQILLQSNKQVQEICEQQNSANDDAFSIDTDSADNANERTAETSMVSNQNQDVSNTQSGKSIIVAQFSTPNEKPDEAESIHPLSINLQLIQGIWNSPTAEALRLNTDSLLADQDSHNSIVSKYKNYGGKIW